MKVRIRMYNAGLGDCFLLTFDPPKGKSAHVLIDCGVLVGTVDAVDKITKRVEAIAKDVNGHLNVIVATHEHWDHVSGFSQARGAFDNDFKTVDEIWFAWTEAPGDELANKLRDDRNRRKDKLKNALAMWDAKVAAMRGNVNPNDPSVSDANTRDEVAAATARLDLTRAVLAFGDPSVMPAEIVANEGLGLKATTKGSMEYLKGRPERKQFLEPGRVCTIPGLEGVRVYVLGPPRDEKLLKKGRPSAKTPETYHLADPDETLSLADSFFAAIETVAALDNTDGRNPSEYNPAAASNDASTPGQWNCDPFDPYYRVSIADAKNQPFYATNYYGQDAWRRIDDEWLGATSSLALALDNDTNNTSLVLAFELPNGDVLLFPADAQVGNWLSWKNVEFKVDDKDGKQKIVTAADLLAKTVLYKVGHHASHNATLREEGLEKMIHPKLTAMVPVERSMAELQGWAMPFEPLFQRLNEKCRGRVVRLDESAIDDERLERLNAREREAFRPKFEDFYVELTLDGSVD